MSKFQYPRVRTFIAGADLSAKKYHAVKLHTTENQVVAAAAGQGIGVLMNAPQAGEAAEVAMLGGGALGDAGATVVAGNEVAANAAGKLIPAVSTNIVLGIALSGAASGEYFEMERVHYVKA
jgi:hypothetical protein